MSDKTGISWTDATWTAYGGSAARARPVVALIGMVSGGSCSAGRG